jgi:spermidine/putrescine transport system permease protein
MAGLLCCVAGVVWLLWLFALTSQSSGWPLVTGWQAIANLYGPALVVVCLPLFAAIDFGLGWLLLNNKPNARRLAFVRAAFGFGVAIAYLLAATDFVGALVLMAVQGGVLVLLSRNSGAVLAYPSIGFLFAFFVVPLLGIIMFSFGKGTALGTIDMSSPSLDNYLRIVQPVGRSGLVYLDIIARTLWVAFLNTVICLLIAYPFAFWMAKQPERLRNALMLLVMIPFWTNLLIRTFAWLIVLRKDGLLNNFLIDVLKVIDRPLELTNTPFALLLGLVYGYLPYMIMPLYSAVERLDKRYMEAASDLYAPPLQNFLRVIFPLTLPGIIAGSILVFIPSVGTYVVANILGGGKIFLIGNLLEQQFFASTGDKAFGAAFGAVLTILMLGATLVYFRLGRKGVG